MLGHQWQVPRCQDWIGAFALIMLVLSWPGACKAGKTIPVETALPIIEALEGRIQVAQWRAEGKDGKLLDPNNWDSIEVPPERRGYYTKWQVIFEPQSGRYRADMESVAGWKDGIAPSAASLESFSCDSKTERCYQRQLPGRKIPTPKEGIQSARVTYPEANIFMDHYGFSAGMYFIPPYFFGRRLSDSLRERIEKKQPLAIQQDEKGLWQIDTTPPESAYASHSDFRITYDPSRGIVLGAEWIGKPSAPLSASKTWARSVLKWAQAEGDGWVPTAYYYYNLLDHQATRLNYSEMRVNQKVDDSVFRITFPPGTRVTDEVEKKIYRTSTGVVDEQEAIRDFIEWEKLRNQPPPSQSHHLVWIIGIGSVLLTAPLFLWWRKRKKVAAILLILLGLLSGPAARAADLDKAGNWTVSHGVGESIRISQCGLNVTIFTLEYFGVPYGVKQVAAGLPPNEHGIRFSDIKAMLESHGLDVIAREKVSVSKLKRALKLGIAAIFLVRITERENHYLIALRHHHRGLLLIDPPVTVRPLSEAVTEEDLAALGGVVLFVRKPKDEESKLSDRVKIDPQSIDLGRFRDDDPTTAKPLLKHITVTNVSDKAVLISDVLTACGCLYTKWKGGVLNRGESYEVPATILLGGWPPGKKTQRDLTLTFADGSVKPIAFVADIVSTVHPRHLQLRPDFVCIELPDEPSTVERQVRVELGDSKSGPLSVSSHSPWLKVDLKPALKGEARLVLRLVPEAIPAEDRVTGEVCLACSSSDPVVKLPVVLNRPARYRIDPSIVRFTPDSTQEKAVLLTPLQKNTPLSDGLSVLSAPKGLRIVRSDKKDKAVQLRLSLTEPPLPVGYYLVHCRLGPNRVPAPSVRFVVHVAEQDGH